MVWTPCACSSRAGCVDRSGLIGELQIRGRPGRHQRRRLLQHRADDAHRHSLDHHHRVGRQQRAAGAPVQDIGAHIRHPAAAPGVLQERSGLGVAAVEQPQQFLRARIKFVIARRADDMDRDPGCWRQLAAAVEVRRRAVACSCASASRFRNCMAGSFCSSRVMGGLAPSRSPAWMISVLGRIAGARGLQVGRQHRGAARRPPAIRRRRRLQVAVEVIEGQHLQGHCRWQVARVRGPASARWRPAAARAPRALPAAAAALADGGRCQHNSKYNQMIFIFNLTTITVAASTAIARLIIRNCSVKRIP